MKKKIPGANNNPNFWASGISIVMHMKNPHVPAIHFNTRFIYTTHGWFGGGMDVTPCLKDNNEKKYLHKELKTMCDRHNKIYYKKYKKWCDEYFFNFFIHHFIILVCLIFSDKIIATDEAIFKDLLLSAIGIFSLCSIKL